MKYLIFSFLSLLSATLYSQQQLVSGLIQDERKEPLLGVSVVDKNSKKWAITDENGKFSLPFQKEYELEIQFLGLHLFRTKARCVNCHFSPLFSDQQFHNLGMSYYGRKYEDLGRYKISKDKADVGSFKTASLREVGRTAPYMHNGLIATLDEVIQMYDAGMPRPKPRKDQENDPLFPTTDPLLQKLSLSKEERAALKAFLLTLSSPFKRERIPELP